MTLFIDKTDERSHSTSLKKPLTAWMLFLTENRERIRDEHSGVEGALKQGDIFKLAGEAFKSLPVDVKKSYEDRARDLMTVYKEELKRRGLDAPSSSTAGEKKGNIKIQKPRDAFHFYCESQPEVIGASEADITSQVKEKFEQLPSSERASWETKALQDKERYDKAMTERKKRLRDAAVDLQSIDVAKKIQALGSVLPEARVRKTIKLDTDVKNVKREAVTGISTAVQMFLGNLAVSAATEAQHAKRKVISAKDIIMAVHSNPLFAFLKEDFPKRAITATGTNKGNTDTMTDTKASVKSKATKVAAIPVGQQSIKAFC